MMKFKIIRRKRCAQCLLGLWRIYKSGIYNEQKWYGLEIPYLDFRLIKYLKN